MTGRPAAVAADRAAPAGGGGVARRRVAQAAAVFRAELRRLLLTPGALGLALVAMLPAVPLCGLWASRLLRPGGPSLADTTTIYAGLYQAFLLRAALYFGCVVIFTSLVRRPLRDRTLHYVFLSPVRREVVLAGKYAAGVAAGGLVFGGATLATFVLAYAPFAGVDAAGLDRFVAGPAVGHLAAYLGVTVLACVGYGAVFLAGGVFLRNPVLPALLVFGWEAANPFLPPALKVASVFYYLHGLCPVPLTAGPFALLAEPPSAALAIVGLLALAAVLLALAALKFRRFEVLYGED